MDIPMKGSESRRIYLEKAILSTIENDKLTIKATYTYVFVQGNTFHGTMECLLQAYLCRRFDSTPSASVLLEVGKKPSRRKFIKSVTDI